MLSCLVVSSSFATPWTAARQAPLSMGFFRQEYQSGLPGPPPRHLPNPGIEPTSPVSLSLQADHLPLSHWGSPINSFTCNLFIASHMHRLAIIVLTEKETKTPNRLINLEGII